MKRILTLLCTLVAFTAVAQKSGGIDAAMMQQIREGYRGKASDKAVKNDLIATFDGYCCEMEGAAIAQAAWLNKVPYLVIRAISDKADGSAEMDYSEFEMKAIEHTVRLVTGMLQNM